MTYYNCTGYGNVRIINDFIRKHGEILQISFRIIYSNLLDYALVDVETEMVRWPVVEVSSLYRRCPGYKQLLDALHC